MNDINAKIILNGVEREIEQPCSVLDLLTKLGWKPTQVVVEHNGCVLPRAEVGLVLLKGGDQVEIILPVAGG